MRQRNSQPSWRIRQIEQWRDSHDPDLFPNLCRMSVQEIIQIKSALLDVKAERAKRERG